MIVYYEQLVLHPRRWLSIILDFLDLPFDEAVMHHHDFINKEGEQGIRVSNKERSSDQIVKPINVEALTQWVGTFPEDLVAEMGQVAPMLSKGCGIYCKENKKKKNMTKRFKGLLVLDGTYILGV
jgi:protein-tyrosine sulfotransferase